MALREKDQALYHHRWCVRHLQAIEEAVIEALRQIGHEPGVRFPPTAVFEFQGKLGRLGAEYEKLVREHNRKAVR